MMECPYINNQYLQKSHMYSSGETSSENHIQFPLSSALNCSEILGFHMLATHMVKINHKRAVYMNQNFKQELCL